MLSLLGKFRRKPTFRNDDEDTQVEVDSDVFFTWFMSLSKKQTGTGTMQVPSLLLFLYNSAVLVLVGVAIVSVFTSLAEHLKDAMPGGKEGKDFCHFLLQLLMVFTVMLSLLQESVHFAVVLFLVETDKFRADTASQPWVKWLAIIFAWLWYIMIPTMAFFLSCATILAAEDRLSIFKDCLAVAFIVELNNVFQIFEANDSPHFTQELQDKKEADMFLAVKSCSMRGGARMDLGLVMGFGAPMYFLGKYAKEFCQFNALGFLFMGFTAGYFTMNAFHALRAGHVAIEGKPGDEGYVQADLSLAIEGNPGAEGDGQADR